MTTPYGAPVSTIPGAVAVVVGYLKQVAALNPDLSMDVYTGTPVTSAVANNFGMVGSFPDGILTTPVTYSWAALSGQFKLRYETYSIQGCFSSWTGAVDDDQLLRLNYAYRMFDAFHQLVVDDIGGSGSLSPSGSWGDLIVSDPEYGQLAGMGWGARLTWELAVINAQLQLN